jgi:hypothetical protein
VAVDWWFDETLGPEHTVDNWHEQLAIEELKPSRNLEVLPRRTRPFVTMHQWKRWIEGAMISKPELSGAMFRVDPRQLESSLNERLPKGLSLSS